MLSASDGGGSGSLVSMPNLPSLDFYMENEIKKATAMLHCFTATLGEVCTGACSQTLTRTSSDLTQWDGICV